MKDYKWRELIKENIKQVFSKFGLRIENWAKRRKDAFIQNLPMDNSEYCDLTPESEIKNGEEYVNALQWAFKNNNVKNVALAGPYGSGKSSIIQTYMKKFPSTKSLNISLATFDLDAQSAEDFENQIELGILKQLFYKVDSDKIPQSRYRKLKKKYYRRYFFLTLCLAVLLCLGVAFFNPSLFDSTISRITESGSHYGLNRTMSFICANIFVVIGIAIIAFILKCVMSKYRIREINIADKATVADDGDNNESVFDRAMDEIVYFFEATDFTVLFIEDLDRFESTEIFIKLRELNTILNNYDLIKRRIVFVYAIRDDMFTNDERTKFFDFIIPVIPIINSTNSGEILREKLSVERQETGEIKSNKYNISGSYITLVAPFIEDMRVLTSICNEFVIYKNALNSVNLKDEEMFSIIIFKNLYPRDFAELEAERGIVKQAFEDKKKFVELKRTELLEKRKLIENRLNSVEKDVLNDVKEVKAAMLSHLAGNYGVFLSIYIGNAQYTYSSIMKDDFDIDILNTNSSAKVYAYGGSNIVINDLRSTLSSSPYRYLQRIQDLKDAQETKNQLCNQLEECDLMIYQIKSYSLKKLIEKYGSDEIFRALVKENKVLVFLLRKGFINENYADYINYFYPNSITKDEMNFIRGIRMQEAIGDFSYNIRNVAEVCERIEDFEFKQEEALNFDVLDYLLTKKKDTKKCKVFIEGLSVGSKKGNSFIREYISRNDNLPIFINLLCKQYVGFLNWVAYSEIISDDMKYYYYSLVLEYADLSDIERINNFEGCNCISDMLVNDAKALMNLSKVSPNKMIQIIDCLDISFANIEVVGVNEDILNYIFENNKYHLNWLMQRALFRWKFPHCVERLNVENYTVTCETMYEPFLNRIYEDFEKYVFDFVVGQDENTNENVSSVEDIIERLVETNQELCKQVIDKTTVVWDELSKCCICSEDLKMSRGNIWNYVLQNNRVEADWNNYLAYFKEYGITDNLVEWFDDNVDFILVSEKTEEVSDAMLLELVSKNLSACSLEKVVKKYSINEFESKVEEFTHEQLSIMIRGGWIPFTVEMFEEIQSNQNTLVCEYAIQYKQDFFENLDEINLKDNEITLILKGGYFSEEEQVKLIEKIMPDDMNMDIAKILRNIKSGIKKDYVESAWELLAEDERYELLLNQLEVYSVEEISEKFSELAPVYKALSGIAYRHKELLPVTDYNTKLVRKLSRKKYITSFDVETSYQKDYTTHHVYEVQNYVVWVKQKVG